MKSSEIRQAFIAYFAERGHEVVPSSSLVPTNDPTLLFTNAGMVQFKETFLGLESRSYGRAVSAQRCLRAGGKHNDLENVGYTARHHTFFEMLGNFSFGDYFKREAIRYAWEFLTLVLKLPPERLWVTIYKDDEEAASIWLNEMKVSPERFSRCGEADNFWSMGDTGPCGPCTEIFYDHGEDILGGPPGSADADGDRYVEIWNLVFMQYNRDKTGQLHPLPKPAVDTGMGLERITAVVQAVHQNYQIDSFQHLIQAIEKLGPIAEIEPQKTVTAPSFKVIADHIRATAFLIMDGVSPSNEGRGYVLRRIIRRAIRHGHRLGLASPFFFKLVAPLCEVMGDVYPQLIAHKEQIEQQLKREETQFTRTLAHGLRLLEEQIPKLQSSVLEGALVFKLYDTYGFPVDLTADIARERGLSVDMEGFERCMNEQRALSQSTNHFEVDYSDASQWTEASRFEGYEATGLSSTITAILQGDQRVDSLYVPSDSQKQMEHSEQKKPVRAAIVLETTPFYAESGGQVGDQGQLLTANGVFKVHDTQQKGQAIIHYGELLRGAIHVNETVEASVDVSRRQAIRLNHTATHLLHAALKQVVGPELQQKGSLVDAARARFDFSCHYALNKQQLQQVEDLVNQQIRANHEVKTDKMSLEDAKREGAMALFDEKYSEWVRVLSIDSFSKELCGGTHASRTGDIGLFKIVSEGSVASGIRRIEWVSGAYALEWMNEQLNQLTEIADQLKTTPAGALEKLSQFLHDAKQKEKILQDLQKKQLGQMSLVLLSAVEKIQGINMLVTQVDCQEGQRLRDLFDQLKMKLEDAVIVLFTIEKEKIHVVAGVSRSLVGRVPSATTFVKHLCGKGGGREEMAQGGGDAPKDLQEKIAQIKAMVVKIDGVP
ncbi:MAG: alanine--tRNA ligase [Legionella sp.]|nr:alanine--tRNA ligase [Legionella sp.]